MANEHTMVGNSSYEKVKTFKYFVSLLKNQNCVHMEIKCRPKAVNNFYYSGYNFPKNLKIKIYIK